MAVFRFLCLNSYIIFIQLYKKIVTVRYKINVADCHLHNYKKIKVNRIPEKLKSNTSKQAHCQEK